MEAGLGIGLRGLTSWRKSLDYRSFVGCRIISGSQKEWQGGLLIGGFPYVIGKAAIFLGSSAWLRIAV
jgi:hypothetical protein